MKRRSSPDASLIKLTAGTECCGFLIGIVTVTHNSAAVIADFMESVLKQTHKDFILYVVDSASSDQTLNMLNKNSDPRVRILANSENIGIAEGNNIGIRSALRDGCDEVLLINNDTVFEADLFSKLHDGLREHHCDMTVPKILFYDDPQKIWSAGGYFSSWRGSARVFGYGKKDDGSFSQSCRVSFSPACCMLIRKEVFEKVGLMDPNYFVYFDDTDFCWRAKQFAMMYIPQCTLLHKVSSLTGGEHSEFTLFYTIRNHTYYFFKHFRAWRLLYLIPAFQIHIFAKHLFLRRSLRGFRIAERAFVKGIRMFREGRPRPEEQWNPQEVL